MKSLILLILLKTCNSSLNAIWNVTNPESLIVENSSSEYGQGFVYKICGDVEGFGPSNLDLRGNPMPDTQPFNDSDTSHHGRDPDPILPVHCAQLSCNDSIHFQHANSLLGLLFDGLKYIAISLPVPSQLSVGGLIVFSFDKQFNFNSGKVMPLMTLGSYIVSIDMDDNTGSYRVEIGSTEPGRRQLCVSELVVVVRSFQAISVVIHLVGGFKVSANGRTVASCPPFRVPQNPRFVWLMGGSPIHCNTFVGVIHGMQLTMSQNTSFVSDTLKQSELNWLSLGGVAVGNDLPLYGTTNQPQYVRKIIATVVTIAVGTVLFGCLVLVLRSRRRKVAISVGAREQRCCSELSGNCERESKTEKLYSNSGITSLRGQSRQVALKGDYEMTAVFDNSTKTCLNITKFPVSYVFGAGDEDLQRVFLSLTSVRCESAAHTVDWFIENGSLFVVSEMCAGATLHSLRKKRGIRCNWKEASIAIVQSMLDFLSKVPRNVHGIIISPHNIIMTDDGKWKLSNYWHPFDFRKPLPPLLDKYNPYIPPETYATGELTVIGSMWSLGVVVHEVLYGSTPAPHCVESIPDSLSSPTTTGTMGVNVSESSLMELDAMIRILLHSDPVQRETVFQHDK